MLINISSFYSEPGFEFQISYKIYQLIQSLLENKVKNCKLANNYLDDENNYTLSIDVSTGKNIKEVDVKGPDVDKRNKFLNYGVWLPYEPINESENYLNTFLDYFFEAIKELLIRYGIDENEVSEIKNIIKEKVINNEEYKFEEEYMPPIDLSDLDLD